MLYLSQANLTDPAAHAAATKCGCALYEIANLDDLGLERRQRDDRAPLVHDDFVPDWRALARKLHTLQPDTSLLIFDIVDGTDRRGEELTRNLGFWRGEVIRMIRSVRDFMVAAGDIIAGRELMFAFDGIPSGAKGWNPTLFAHVFAKGLRSEGPLLPQAYRSPGQTIEHYIETKRAQLELVPPELREMFMLNGPHPPEFMSAAAAFGREIGYSSLVLWQNPKVKMSVADVTAICEGVRA